jgi:hypothetical protein
MDVSSPNRTTTAGRGLRGYTLATVLVVLCALGRVFVAPFRADGRESE